jgi:acyl-CoA thioester hydrolase
MFSIDLRIDYQDTDATGLVYHSHYLAFMERARNAALRDIGYPLSSLQLETGIVFVLVRAVIDFRQPAFLDDALQVRVDDMVIGGSKLVFHQRVMRGDVTLVKGEIITATLDAKTYKPCRIPSGLRQAMKAISQGEAAA